jgi:hypothetical protein
VTGITDGFAFLLKIDKITIINMTTRRIIIIMHKDEVNKTLFFFDIQILIAPLVFSNSSWTSEYCI